MAPKRKATSTSAIPNKKKSSATRVRSSSKPYKIPPTTSKSKTQRPKNPPFKALHTRPREDLSEDGPGEDPEDFEGSEDSESSDPEPPSLLLKQSSQSNNTNDPSHHPDTSSSESSGTPEISTSSSSSSEDGDEEDENNPNATCQGTLQNGNPCSRIVGPKGAHGYCWQHRGQVGAAAKKSKKKVRKIKKMAKKWPAGKPKKKSPSPETETSSSDDRPAPVFSETESSSSDEEVVKTPAKKKLVRKHKQDKSPSTESESDNEDDRPKMVSSESQSTDTEDEEVIKKPSNRKLAKAKKNKSPSPESESEGESGSDDEEPEMSNLTDSESDIEAPRYSDKAGDSDKSDDLDRSDQPAPPPNDSGDPNDPYNPNNRDNSVLLEMEGGSQPEEEEQPVYPFPGQKCLPEIDYEEDPGCPMCQGIMVDKPFSAQCNNPPIKGTKLCEEHKKQGEAEWDDIESSSSDEESTTASESEGSATQIGEDDELPYWDDSDDGVCPLEYESSGWSAVNQQNDAAIVENEEKAVVGDATQNTKATGEARQDGDSSGGEVQEIPRSSQPTERSEREDVVPVEEAAVDDGNLADTEKDEQATIGKNPEAVSGKKRKAPEDNSDPEERYTPRKLSRGDYPVFDNRQVIYYEHTEGSIFGRPDAPEKLTEASGSNIEDEIEPETEDEAPFSTGEASVEIE